MGMTTAGLQRIQGEGGQFGKPGGSSGVGALTQAFVITWLLIPAQFARG
jgi:hypothetical protein